MAEGGESLTTVRSGMDIIAHIENDERLLEDVKARADVVFEETSGAIIAAEALAREAKAEIDTVEEAIRDNYQELQQSFRENSNDAPEFAAGIIYGRNLHEAREVEQKLKVFNQLITVPNTPLLKAESGRYLFGVTAGEPADIQLGRLKSDIHLAVPVSRKVKVERIGSFSSSRTEGFDIATSEQPLSLDVNDVQYPVMGEFSQELFVRPLNRDFDALLIGHEAVNQFFELLKINPEESGEISSVTQSSIFGIWVASRLANLSEAGIEIEVDDEIVENWRDQLKFHSVHYLSAAVEHRKVDVLLNPELTKAAHKAFETSSAEAVDILREALTESAWTHDTEEQFARRYDLLKVYLKHDLGLVLPEDM